MMEASLVNASTQKQIGAAEIQDWLVAYLSKEA